MGAVPHRGASETELLPRPRQEEPHSDMEFPPYQEGPGLKRAKGHLWGQRMGSGADWAVPGWGEGEGLRRCAGWGRGGM